MCRNIRVLHHFEPPATAEEIRASALQYVRKLSGMHEPSAANQEAFERAVNEVTRATQALFRSLEVHGPPRDREVERRKAQAKWRAREARMRG